MRRRTTGSRTTRERRRNCRRPKERVYERRAVIGQQEAIGPELGPSLRVVDGAYTSPLAQIGGEHIGALLTARIVRFHAHDIAVGPVCSPGHPVGMILHPYLVCLLEILVCPPVRRALNEVFASVNEYNYRGRGST